MKKWTSPKLIVILRANSEETIMTSCKVTVELSPLTNCEWTTCNVAGSS
ncbi:MAG: hypothetical protein ACFFBD_16950 [Candidatus Hodarchaeota archaeon]